MLSFCLFYKKNAPGCITINHKKDLTGYVHELQRPQVIADQNPRRFGFG
jgi:hypothetical protein